MSRTWMSGLRPLCVAVGLTTAAGLVTALPAQAGTPGAERQRLRSKVVAASTLAYTVDWAYDVNDRGVGYAVWLDGDSERRRVLVARRNPKGAWSEPQVLSGLFSWKGKKGYAGYSDVAVDDKGRATVVWTQPNGDGVRVRVVSSRGKGWTQPRGLSARGDFAGFPDVEVSDTGYAVVQWAGHFPYPPKDVFSLWAAYRDKDGSWSPPDQVDTSPDYNLDARAGSLAIDDRGLATVAYDEIGVGVVGGATGRIQVAIRGPDSDWSQQTLATGPHGDSPGVATTPDGLLVAAWRDDDGILVQRRSAAGTWEPPQQVVVGPEGISHNLFGVGISHQGRAALLGQEVVEAGNQVRPYVLVQDAPGSAWAREYVADGYPQYHIDPFQPQLHVGSSGEVAVTWNRQFEDLDRWFRTFVRLRTEDGRWKPAHQVGRHTSDPELASDGRGRVSLVFGDGGSTSGCCLALRAGRLT